MQKLAWWMRAVGGVFIGRSNEVVCAVVEVVAKLVHEDTSSITTIKFISFACCKTISGQWRLIILSVIRIQTTAKQHLTRNACQSLAYSLLGRVVSPPNEYL